MPFLPDPSLQQPLPPQPSVPPTTTAQQDIVTAGQRRINVIWEVTQSVIALAVTGSTLYVAAKLSLFTPSQTASFLLLSNAFFLVVGFYFGRTNHQRQGGVGSQGQDPGR